MKRLILRLLALLRLAPASHVDLARAQARRVADRTERVEAQLSKLRADRDAWKQSHHEMIAAVAEWKEAAASATEDAKRAKAETERLRGQADDWRTRAEALTTQLRELRERLEESRRVGSLAREHLMATEAKLDLIEAAIHVLDGRTREAAISRS